MYIYNKQIYNDIYSYFRKYCAFTSLRLWVFILFPCFTLPAKGFFLFAIKHLLFSAKISKLPILG